MKFLILYLVDFRFLYYRSDKIFNNFLTIFLLMLIVEIFTYIFIVHGRK